MGLDLAGDLGLICEVGYDAMLMLLQIGVCWSGLLLSCL